MLYFEEEKFTGIIFNVICVHQRLKVYFSKAVSIPKSEIVRFGVNEKLLTQHISGPVTKYKLLYVSNQGRAWARVRARHIVIC